MPALSPRVRSFVGVAILVAFYFFAGKAGLTLASVNPSATIFWPPTGIAIGCLLLLGIRLWPAVFLGAFLVNITTAGSIFTTLGIATGNTLEAVIAVTLINRYANGRNTLETPGNLFRFFILAGVVSTAVSAFIGVSSLSLIGFAKWSDFQEVFLTWWLGDMGGALLVAPLIISWFNRPRFNFHLRHISEIAVVFFLLLLTTFVIFGGFLPLSVSNYSVDFLAVPFFLWIAFRFNQREVATALFLFAEIAVWGTLQGFGPFAKGASVGDSLLLLQAYLNVRAATMLMLSSVVIMHRNTEELARKSEEQYKTLVEMSPDAIVVMDLQTNITMLNKQAVSLVGFENAEEVLGKTAFSFIAPEDHQRTRENLAKLATVRRLTGIEYTIVRKDGTRFIASTSASVLVDQRGNPQGIIVVVRDVTHEKELDRMKDEFISVASHELRTPMAAIKGYLSMILSGRYGQISGDLQKPLVTVALSTDRLIQLVNDILSISRIETKRLKLTLTLFPLASVVDDIGSNLVPILRGKHLGFHNGVEKNVRVQADPQKVGQILTNLVGNALKFTDTGGISIASTEENERIVVLITDTGVGISKENQEKLFRKFQQVSSQQAGRPAGTGLGLYISRELAKAMGGDVWLVSSEVGKGSTFAVSLPKEGTTLAASVRQILTSQIHTATFLETQHPS
ncbi:MAG: MASE1 domain-containing protein [bacterium]|nr:MASE1 domain-containing protein [bacterium]